jgi:PST family polysaccharide transporter
MGIGGALTLVGRDFIRVLLGPGWDPAGRIFTLFGPGFGIMFLYGIHSWIHLSIGRPGRWFKWGIIEFFVTGLLFIMALPWGPAGVATAWSLSLLILTIPALRYAGKPIDLGTAPIIAAIWKFVASALLATCITSLIIGGLRFPDTAPNLFEASVRIATVSVLFCVLYIAVVILLHRSLTPLYQVAGLVQEIMPWGKSSPSHPALSQAT